MVGNMNKLENFLIIIKEMGAIVDSNKVEKSIEYLALPNKKNVKWLMPLVKKNGKKNSFLLYQPSSLKAKLLKFIFINTPNLILKIIFRKSIVWLNTTEFLRKIIKNQDKYNYSFFLGTDGLDCKPTIQISDDIQPIMYLKVTNKNNVKNLFNNEEKILKVLNSTEINEMCPKVIINEVYGKLSVFASSTTKAIKSEYIKDLINEHVNFLVKLYFSTKKYILSKRTKYYIYTQQGINSYIKNNPTELWILDSFNQAINKLIDKKVYICTSHRDFTMWNCYFNNKKIFVFDWEYANEESLPFFDILHFIIKKSILDGISVEVIYKSIINNDMINKYAKEINISIEVINSFIILYLIDIILLYDFKIDTYSKEELRIKNNRLKLMKYVLELGL